MTATKDRLAQSLAWRCEFPARALWLERQGFAVAKGPCPEFDKFRDKLAVRSVTFVYATAYANNPASMFGHAILRLNKLAASPTGPSAAATELLNNSVAFLARVDQGDDPLSYTVKGIFGGYPGYYSIDPYYTTVALYNDGESRDLWELDLDLTPGEVELLVAHLFELVHHASFPYYFYDQNCAYQLLSLLEAARPAVDLTGEARFFVLPLETMRAVSAAFGGKAKDRRRPSLKRQLTATVAALGAEERRAFDDVRSGERSVQDLRQPATVDALIAYWNFQKFATKNHLEPDEATGLRDALVQRARLGRKSDAPPGLDDGALPPETGHPPLRLAIGAGHAERSGNFVEFAARPGLHDLLNSDQGYESFAAIDYFDLHGRYYEDERRFALERATVIDITSLTPFDVLTQQWSWRLALEWQRIPEDPVARELHGEAAGGLTVSLLRDKLAAYLLAVMDADLGRSFARSFRMGPGVNGGLLLKSSGGARKIWLEGLARRDWTAGFNRRGLRVGTAWALSSRFDIRAAYNFWRADQTADYHEFEAGAGWQL